MNNTNTQNDLFDTPPQIYDIDSINIEEVLNKATEIAYVYVPGPIDVFSWGLITDKYHNIKKVHIFTSIECKHYFKNVENDSRYNILYMDEEEEKDPLKDCYTKFDYIYINRFDLAFKKSEIKFVNTDIDISDLTKIVYDYDPILGMKILYDAIEHLKDENSILVHKTDSGDLVVYKKPKK